jgi:hypothetical protein
MNHTKLSNSSLLLAGLFCTALAPTSLLADQVFLDDIIVDGSACIGFDCVNGESFGFDTIRIKENNLRIKAIDTSSSSSFPTNDWQITFNDSANGGANKFSIDDIDGGRTPFTIEAGAPSHSLYVDDSGRLGLGTSTPVVDAHVKSGNTPTMRLEQDGSSGFSSQTWDIAGNEANFFIRDASNGSTLPFRIIPGANSNALLINSDNKIGMGTNAPDAALHVKSNETIAFHAEGTGTKQFNVESTDNGAIQFRLISGVANNRRILARNSGNTATLTQIELGDNAIKIAGANINANLWLTIDSTGITTSGAGACNPGPCDAVFDPEEFRVESIKDHARFMWENKYLWGVGPTKEGDPINLTKKTAGILHELEKAHIYIEQLHKNLENLEARLAKLEK